VTRLEVRRRALRHDLVRQSAPERRAGLTWPRLPAAAEVAIIGAGYLAYALMTDILVSHHLLGAADPHGPDRLVNLYAAMPSLHVAWATWCAVAAITTATRSRWRHLAWLYPWVTVLVVLASANHFLLDAAGGLAVLGLGLLGTAGNSAGPATVTGEPAPGRTRPAGADRR